MSKTDLTYGTLIQYEDGSLFMVIGFHEDGTPKLMEVSQPSKNK